LVAGLHTLAVAVALVAWGATRGDSQPNDQIPWIVVAACAAALSGAVNAGWLLLFRREIGDRHQTLATRIIELHQREAGSAIVDAAVGTDNLVVVPRSDLYHRVGCALVDGRPAEPVHPGDHHGRGLRPCGWCSA
jgi:hypothetical protein